MANKTFSAILAFLLLAALIAVSLSDHQNHMAEAAREAEREEAAAFGTYDAENTVVLWYADDALTEFLTTNALSYQAETGIHVETVLVSGVDYLEQINTASVYNGEEASDGTPYRAPDLFVTTHDTLMRAYLAGLACTIQDPHGVVVEENFPQTSLHAASCDDKLIAYPLSYETNFFLYNKTYMQDIARTKVEAESDRIEGEAAQAAADAEGAEGENADEGKKKEKEDEQGADDGKKKDEASEGDEDAGGEGEGDMPEEEGDDLDPMGEEDVEKSPEVLKKLATMIPQTIDDIKNFANNYDAPENVEAVFKWDVSDIFYNYFFVGNYMNVGGENGDNNGMFNIYNRQSVECLQVYQDMNNFFSIDAKEVNYDKILQEFLDGKTVFTVATTDAVAKIEEAALEGDFNYEYGISVLPDVSSTLKARGLSVTTVIAVNGYGEKKAQANDLASYLSFEKGPELYRKAGKISCRRGCVYDNNEIYNIMNEYEKSVPLPKMIETTNFWVQLEIAMSKVWNGADPDETLHELSDTIGAQIEEIDYHIPVQESIEIGGAGVFVP